MLLRRPDAPTTDICLTTQYEHCALGVRANNKNRSALTTFLLPLCEDRRDVDVVGLRKVSCHSFAKLGGKEVTSRRLDGPIPLNCNGEAHNVEAHDALLWNTSL